MRANEFLVEVEMTPNALRREASKINAKAGMEFEMYVPGAAEEDEDAESEADYEQDESANDIDDIINFFNEGDMNGRRDLARLRDTLEEAYDEYVTNEQEDQWQNEGKELLKEYIEEHEFDMDEAIDQAMNNLGFTAEEKDEAKDAGESAHGIMTSKELPDTDAYRNWVEAVTEAERAPEEMADEEWESQGRTYDTVRDSFINDLEAPDQRDWLRSEGYYHMSDIENHFDITWPHWTTPDSGGDLDIETVGASFSKALGKKVMTGGYHRAGRSDTAYSLEPDGSLDDPLESTDGGLEFISPPMSVPDLLDDLKKVKAWADKTGCYTNESTGLHINVSVPQGAHRDYVKLALLLGDDYILEKFGREANTFCKSSLAQVKQYANNEANARAVLDKMRTRLDSMASQAIHTGNTNKYVSINNKGDYVEFRSPGGDWLGDNFDQIENTLLRTVVALDASSDPMKYRKEYLKKLYKILAPMGERDPLSIFAQYVSGDMSKDTMKHLLKQIQQQRTAKKGATAGGKYWYRVVMTGTGAEIEVVAGSPEEAREIAMKEWVIDPGPNRPRLEVFATRPYEAFSAPPGGTRTRSGHLSNTGQNVWWNLTYRDGYTASTYARSRQEAMITGASPGHGEIVSVLQDPASVSQSTEDQLSAAYDQAFPLSEAPNTTGPGDYALVDTSNNEIIWAWHSESRQAAHDFAVQWLNDHPDSFDPEQRRYFQLRRS